MASNKHWVVAARPETEVLPEHFELRETPLPELQHNQILIQVRWLVLSPPLRMALTSGGISRTPIPLGDVMRSTGLGQIAVSRHPDFAEGDLVTGNLGWQEFLVSDGQGIAAAGDPRGLPESTLLHVLGAGGATAYVGMGEYGKPRVGDTLVVSAAAGNVGSIVCQLGRLQGCRVVGIAGSQEKCEWLVNELGCSSAINYKSENVAQALAASCPKGIDIYFDNVGGEVLDTCLGMLRRGARVVLCGGTSQYNHDHDWYGPKNYFNLVYQQATMSGFYIFNFQDQFRTAHDRLAQLIRDAELQYAEDIVEGIENAPGALTRVLSGANFGTQLVRIAES
ncbi:MAG: NADP-dependent oxidoreductase [Pseudomonadales bacterium]